MVIEGGGVYKQANRNEETIEFRALCFICAVKAALTADPKEESIHLVVKSDTFNESCACCGSLIKDEIDL